MLDLRSRVIPEIIRFQAEQDRERAWLRACGDAGLYYWLYVCICMGVLASGVCLAFSDSDTVLYVVFFGFLLPPISLLTWVLRKRIRRSLRHQLRERGQMLCVCCGYDLTGNQSGVCPECGAKARLTTCGTPNSE